MLLSVLCNKKKFYIFNRMEKLEGRALLEKLLNKNMKIKMTDGRTLIGMICQRDKTTFIHNVL